jgi:hypothetical protein
MNVIARTNRIRGAARDFSVFAIRRRSFAKPPQRFREREPAHEFLAALSAAQQTAHRLAVHLQLKFDSQHAAYASKSRPLRSGITIRVNCAWHNAGR